MISVVQIETPTLGDRSYLAPDGEARRLARELPDGTAVFPTHGFGSFCAATQAVAQSSTIGREKLSNPALTLDEKAYVEALLAGLDAWPAYYAHMGATNLAGADAPDLSPPRLASAAALRRSIDAGEWVVDPRDRVAFAAGFVPGSFGFPLGYRSTVAASLLAARGRDVISIDDEIGNAVTAGLPVISSQVKEARR